MTNIFPTFYLINNIRHSTTRKCNRIPNYYRNQTESVMLLIKIKKPIGIKRLEIFQHVNQNHGIGIHYSINIYTTPYHSVTRPRGR